MKHLKTFNQINEAEKDKPKKMADMSKDEKIAAYREKISKERKDPTPDQTKIEDLKKKIEALQKDEKPKPKKK